MPQILKNFDLGKLMQIALTLLFLSFLLPNQDAQSQQVTWYKIFNGPYPTANDYGYATCRADGDNLYVLGSISNARIYLLKLNALGDTIWTKLLGNDFSRGRAIVESDSGSCVLTGDIENGQAFAIKIGKSGNIIWEKYYGGSYVQIYCIKPTQQRGYLLCGSQAPFEAIVLKIDYEGELVWSKGFSAGYKINFQSVLESESKNIFITGWTSESATLPTTGLILKLSSDGNRLWDTVFHFNNQSTGGRKVIATGDGYAICGEVFFGKLFYLNLNQDGRIEQSHVFDSSHYRFDIGDLKMISNNRFLINFSQDSNGISINGKILVFDSLGIEIRNKTYSSKDQISFGSITQLGDTGYVFCGTLDNDLVTNRDIFVIKSDTLFGSNPPIGIGMINQSIPETFSIKNYPNPFNPQTTIRFDVPKDAMVSVRIYDLLGREVYNYSGYQTAGTHELKFDGSNFASGMYFYSVESNGFKETKKMVLLK